MSRRLASIRTKVLCTMRATNRVSSAKSLNTEAAPNTSAAGRSLNPSGVLKPVADILDSFVSEEEVKALAEIASSRADHLHTDISKTVALMLSSGGLFLLIHYSQLTSATVFDLQFSNFDIPYLLLLILANYKSAEFSELRAAKGLNDLVLHWCLSRQFRSIARGGNLPLIFNAIHDAFPNLSKSNGFLVRARYSVPILKKLPFALGFIGFPLWSCYAVWSSHRFPWWVCSIVSVALIYFTALSILNISYFPTLWDEAEIYKHAMEAPDTDLQPPETGSTEKSRAR